MNPERVEASRAKLSLKAASAADEVEARVAASTKLPSPVSDAEAAIRAVQKGTSDFRQRAQRRARLKTARLAKKDSTKGVDAFNGRIEPGLPAWTVPELFVMGPRFHRSTSQLLENRIAQDETRKKTPPTSKDLGRMFGAMLSSKAQPLAMMLGQLTARDVDGNGNNAKDHIGGARQEILPISHAGVKATGIASLSSGLSPVPARAAADDMVVSKALSPCQAEPLPSRSEAMPFFATKTCLRG